MRKLFKILGVLVGVVLLVVVAAAVIIPMTFDPNDYKPQIIAAVKKQTGRDLTIDGDLQLTVFPWVGITTGLVELGNAPGFDGEVFARTDKVSARVKLLPLLSSEVVMDTVSVHGLGLNLIRKPNGTTNWDDLVKAGDTAQTRSSDDAPAIGALAIGGLDVKNANLSWDDQQLGQRFKVINLNVETGSLSPGKPVDLDVSFDVEGGPPQLAATVALTGSLRADPESGAFDSSGMKLEVTAQGGDFPDGVAMLSVRGDVAANLKADTASLTNLVIETLGLEASGTLALANMSTEPALDGGLTLAQFNPRKMLEQLGVPAIVTADPKALSALSVTTQISGTVSNVKLSGLEVKLDDTTMRGSATYAKRLSFDLAADALDADRYLPPGASDGAGTPGVATGAAADLPVETLRGLDLDGKLALGKLKISNLRLSDIALTVKASGGDIRLNPISAKLYEGSYSGNIGLDARGPTPVLSMNEKLSDVRAGPLLKDLTGEERLSGTSNVSAKLTAIGANPQAMKKTLNGTAAFTFTDGALNGVNIAEMIRNAKATLLGGQAAAKGPQKTDFTELGGTAQISNGLITNNDFAAKSPLLRIAGKGTADLPTEALDYRVKATIVASAEGQGGKELLDLTGVPIPVHVTGTFAKPSYALDMQELAAIIAKSKTEKLLDGGVGGVTKNAGELLKGGAEGAGGLLKDGAEGAGDLLKGLLGN